MNIYIYIYMYIYIYIYIYVYIYTLCSQENNNVFLKWDKKLIILNIST